MSKQHDTHPKGKKSVSWREDGQILRRLVEVEDLVLAGYRNTEIAHYLSTREKDRFAMTEATVRRDRERIAILWREQAASSIVDKRSRSIANFRRLQRLADNDYRRAKDNDLLDQRPTYLRVQLEAEREISKLEGTQTPVEQNVNVRDVDKPLETLSTADMLKRAAALESLAKKLRGEQEAEEQEGADDDGEPPVGSDPQG